MIKYYEDFLCPKCNGLAMLDYHSSVIVVERMVRHLKDSFDKELSSWQVDYLVTNLAARRERIARNFFKKYSSAPIGDLANLTLLISKCFKLCRHTGKTTEDKQEITDLFNKFLLLNRYENILLRVRGCYSNVLCINTYDNQNLSTDQLFRNIIIVGNEHYENLKRTFALHDIYTDEEAQEVIEKLKKEIDQLNEKPENIKYTLLSPRDFIKKYFPLLNSIYVLFVQDYNHLNVFRKLNMYRDVMTDPRSLIRFIARFERVKDSITISKKEEFLKYATSYFNVSTEKVENVLVCRQSNSQVFPLFNHVDITDLEGDIVIISSDFSRFIYAILHVFLTQSLYDQETQRRSLHFEQTIVKNKFESLGYKYLPDITIKNRFQIDGVALKENECYVVECKGPRLPHLIYEKSKKDGIIRDLTGIVRGEKYTFSQGKLRIENRPGLKSKVDYVKENFVNLGIEGNPQTEGLIVIPDYPPVALIEGIRVISIDQIDELKSE